MREDVIYSWVSLRSIGSFHVPWGCHARTTAQLLCKWLTVPVLRPPALLLSHQDPAVGSCPRSSGPQPSSQGTSTVRSCSDVTVHTSQCRLLHCSLRLYTRSFYWPVEQPASLFPRWIRQFALAQGKMWKPAQFLLRWLCRGSPEKNVFLRKQRWKFLERYAIEAVPSAPAAEVSTPNAGSVETEGPWASARLWWLPDHWLPVQTAEQELGVL